MTKKQEYWKVPLTPKQKRNLDTNLIEELNEQYNEEAPKGKKRSPAMKLIGILTALVFTAIVLANGFKVFTLPPLDFLLRSLELAKDPQVQQLQRGVVSVNALNRRGTGFNIDPSGLIVTNHHVIQDARVVYVGFKGGGVYYGQKINSFPEVDLAVIKIDGDSLPALDLDYAYKLDTAKEVMVIGNPLGFSQVVKEGKIIGETLLGGWNTPVLMIEGSAIHHGSSGSPVFNPGGKVVAVIFATLVRDSKDQDIIGLAVPIKHLLERISY